MGQGDPWLISLFERLLSPLLSWMDRFGHIHRVSRSDSSCAKVRRETTYQNHHTSRQTHLGNQTMMSCCKHIERESTTSMRKRVWVCVYHSGRRCHRLAGAPHCPPICFETTTWTCLALLQKRILPNADRSFRLNNIFIREHLMAGLVQEWSLFGFASCFGW